MSDNWYSFFSLDLPPLLTALFSALSCALLGNFLLLRRLSLMADAISHSVLPGIVLAFLFSQTRVGFPVFFGAAIAGMITIVLVELLTAVDKVDQGAAMGVVFSALFALGVILIEQVSARSVDLDADCLLHGQLETIFWFPPKVLNEFWDSRVLFEVPAALYSSLAILVLCLLFVVVFYKELLIASFDEALATALGFNSRRIHFALMFYVALAIVASFQAVGSILVIAMIICPPAAARMFTDRLKVQLILSQIFAGLSVLMGYYGAAFAPVIFNTESSLNAAGMMASSAGLLLLLGVVLAPRYGYLSQWVRHGISSINFAREDILAYLYRVEEGSEELGKQMRPRVLDAVGGGLKAHLAKLSAIRRGELRSENNLLYLTITGSSVARSVVRTHRLWESYLVQNIGLRSDHVHERARELEHFRDPQIQEELNRSLEGIATDPHGKEIPE